MLAYQPVRSLATLNISIQQGLSGASRVIPIIDEKQTIKDSATSKDLIIDSAKINFAMGNNAWEGCQLELVIYPKSSAESSYQGNSVIMNGFYETNGGNPRATHSASFAFA